MGLTYFFRGSMRRRNLLLVGLMFLLLAGLGAYYILFQPVMFRAVAPDGTELMLVCGDSVCEAPISQLPGGLPADGIIVENRTPVRITLPTNESGDASDWVTTTLPDGTTIVVPGDSGSSPGSDWPGGAEEPQPPPDGGDTAALSIVLRPRPGQRVEIEVAGRTYYVVYDSEGRVIATNIVDLPGPFSTVAEDAKTAIVTYVLAPFISGLVFTIASFTAASAVRRPR